MSFASRIEHRTVSVLRTVYDKKYMRIAIIFVTDRCCHCGVNFGDLFCSCLENKNVKSTKKGVVHWVFSLVLTHADCTKYLGKLAGR